MHAGAADPGLSPFAYLTQQKNRVTKLKWEGERCDNNKTSSFSDAEHIAWRPGRELYISSG